MDMYVGVLGWRFEYKNKRVVVDVGGLKCIIMYV